MYNAQNTQFTILTSVKCTILRLSVHLQCFTTITAVQVQSIFISPKETPPPVSSHFPLPSLPSPWQPPICSRL